MLAQRVAVVGGGVGGLAVANALMRKGLDVQVYEKAPFFSPSAGAGFMLQPNGLACLRELGLPSKQLEALVHPLYEMIMVGQGGKELARSSAFADIHAMYGLPVGGVERSKLIAALAEPLTKAGRVTHNMRAVHAEQDANAARVTFSCGTVAEADLIIGADGVHSALADALDEQLAPAFPPNPPPSVRELLWFGIVDCGTPFQHPGLARENALLEDLSRDEFIAYRLGTAGEPGPAPLTWTLTHRPATTMDANEFSTEWCDSCAGIQAATLLRDHLTSAGFHADHPIHEVARNTFPGRLWHFPLAHRAHREAWYSGRIALLGDACHPTLPYAAQGANMALEDAVVIADCLFNAPHLEAALSQYVDRRHARTKAVVDLAESNGELLRSRSSHALTTARDAVLGAVVSSGLAGKAFENVIDGCPVTIKPPQWP